MLGLPVAFDAVDSAVKVDGLHAWVGQLLCRERASCLKVGTTGDTYGQRPPMVISEY